MTAAASSRLTSRPAPSRRRVPAAVRREQILSAARGLFVTEGVDRTSMRAIAAKVGVTPTALYDHFADKAQLMVAIADGFFDLLHDRMQAAVASERDPIKRLRTAGREYVMFGLEHREEYRLLFMSPHTEIKRMMPMRARLRVPAGDPDADVSRGARAFAVLENLMGDLIAAGEIRKVDKATLAETIWAVVHGIAALRITHDKFDFASLDHVLEMAFDMILNGLLPKKR